MVEPCRRCGTVACAEDTGESLEPDWPEEPVQLNMREASDNDFTLEIVNPSDHLQRHTGKMSLESRFALLMLATYHDDEGQSGDRSELGAFLAAVRAYLDAAKVYAVACGDLRRRYYA